MKQRIVVMGYMLRCPIAGVIWQYLHYIAGFQRLGFEVSYLEDASCWPHDARTDDLTHTLQTADALARQYSFAWGYRASYRNPPATYGSAEQGFSETLQNADAIFDVCGVQGPLPEFQTARCPVYVETDPGPEQIKMEKGEQQTIDYLKTYRHHFTFGEKLGHTDCPIPITNDIQWRHTRQPVVLDYWKNDPLPDAVEQLRFTTISNWKAQGKEIEWNNEIYYWSKHFEFLKFYQVPQVVKGAVPIIWEIATALDGDVESKLKMENQGWLLKKPKSISDDAIVYRDFIRNSDGEWTIAKDQYTRLNTGWFSDRSVCYLAASRPVITQETGFSDVLPQGEGLFAFRNIGDIQSAVDKILTNPRKQSRAALEIAAEYFAAEKVCRKMIEEIGL